MALKGEGNRYRLFDVKRDGKDKLRVLIYYQKCQEYLDVISKEVDVTDITGTALDAEDLSQVDVLLSFSTPPEILARLTSLKWIQSTGVGIDNFLAHCRKNPQILVTKAEGFAAESAASLVLMTTLAFHWNLLGRIRDQQNHHWEPHSNYQPEPLISTRTMGIIGLGQIGAMIAAHAKHLGMRVIGTKRTPNPVEGVDAVYSPEELGRVLAESDFVVLSLPLVEDTRALIGAAELKTMRPTAVLINVARGGVIDEAALIAALNEKTIAGAALDVFPVEPLPAESPLWDAPNILITPHVAGNRSDAYGASAVLFANNLKVFGDKQKMAGICNLALGY